jgi:hypothetical protein
MYRRLVVALGLIGAVGIVAPTGSTIAAPKKVSPTKKVPKKKKITVKKKLQPVEFMVGSGGATLARKGWSFSMVCSKAMHRARGKAKTAAVGMCKQKGGSGDGGKFFDLSRTTEKKGDVRKCVVAIKYRLKCALSK